MLFRNPQAFQRIVVGVKDVLGPFVCIMVVNVATLICWTIISPRKYIREYYEGTDEWNRLIGSYGACQSDAKIYSVILTIVNFGMLVVANFQAYQARSIRTEFSESRYISIIMASLLQGAVLAIPILALTRDKPRVMYVVEVNLIFLLCMVTLGFMFIPKVILVRKSIEKAENKRINVRVSGLDHQ